MRAFSYFVRSNVWIALGAPSLLGLSCLEWGISYPYCLGIAAFFFVLLSYNLQRWIRTVRPRKVGKDVASAFFSAKAYLVLVILSALGSGISLFFFELELLLALLPPALLSVFYALPVFGAQKGLRDLPYLKVFWIALSWAYLTVPVVAVHSGLGMDLGDWQLFWERFFFVFAVTVPFDIRDLPYDDPEERTIPQVLGGQGAKCFALSALGLFLGSVCLRFYFGEGDLPLLLAYTLTGGVAGLLIARADIRKPDLYYEGLLDGTLLFIFLAALFFFWLL